MIAAHAKSKDNESRAKERRKKPATRNRAAGKKNAVKKTTEAVKKAGASLKGHTIKISWDLALARKARDESNRALLVAHEMAAGAVQLSEMLAAERKRTRILNYECRDIENGAEELQDEALAAKLGENKTARERKRGADKFDFVESDKRSNRQHPFNVRVGILQSPAVGVVPSAATASLKIGIQMCDRKDPFQRRVPAERIVRGM